MQNVLPKYINKLFVKQWAIGLARGDIADIIRRKQFNLDFRWLPIKSINQFHADPFPFKNKDGNISILFEDYTARDRYGKISLITIDKTLKQLNYKIVLDTKNHLSYPFLFIENNKIYVFPEACKSGTLSCYEYNPVNRSLIFLQRIIDLPLLDSTILKYNNKYWLFGTLLGYDPDKKLNIYFSNNLLGPYTPHFNNPVKATLNGARPAGNFIKVDGVIYRPSQNSENRYGESITINKIAQLNENDFVEEPYMSLTLNKENNFNYGIHTINVIDDLIVVDGLRCKFSPVNQLIKVARSGHRSNK